MALEACSLSRAYADWLAANPAILDRFALYDRPVSVLLVGTTVAEAGRLVQALRSGTRRALCVSVHRPLGPAADPYCFLHDELHAQWPSAAADLAALLAEQGVEDTTVAVAPYVSLEEMPESEFDMVLFGPLAFTALAPPASVSEAAHCAELARLALTKTKIGNGLVLFCARESTPWQAKVFVEQASQSAPRLRDCLSLVFSGEDQGLFAASSQITSCLPVDAAFRAQLDTVVKANLAKQVGATDLYRQRLVECIEELGCADDLTNPQLEECGTLVVASWQSLASLSGVGTQLEGAAPDLANCNAEWWPEGRDGEFVNVGLNLWNQQREQWQRAVGPVDRTPAAPIPYDEVLTGLASLRRTYELPHPIRLPDLIDIYLDIWESLDGY